MARAYINKLSELMERAAPKGSPEAKLEVKHFFSGAAVYANGKICITLTPIGLALKLPEEDIKSLIDEEGAKPLQYFPEGPIKKNYVLLPGNIVGDSKKLEYWVKLSIEYVTR